MLNWAIKTFDQHVADKRSPAVKRDYKDLRLLILKALLKEYYEKDLIRFAEYQTLEIQLESQDRDDWYMAFLAIKQLKNRR